MTAPHFSSATRGLAIGATVLSTLLVLVSAVSMEPEPSDADQAVAFLLSVDDVPSSVSSVYAQLREVLMLSGYHDLSEHSSDEVMVPTRGADWDDGGRWRAMHQHTWDASLVDLDRAWTTAYTGVDRANAALERLQNLAPPPPDRDVLFAEVRMLRAFYFYLLMDLFGGVPLTDGAMPARASRADVFSFIESELQAVLPDLPTRWDAANYGRVTQGAAFALLAKIYLNAEVFTATPTIGGLSGGTPRWQDAVDAVDAILNSGVYSLEANWPDVFAADNHQSPENIFVAPHLNREGLGFNFNMRQLHYNQLVGITPWNGFTTLADFVNSYDDDDLRKEVFLVGQQYSDPNSGCFGRNCFSTGTPLTDRSGNPLVFTLDIPGIILGPNPEAEGAGARILKWELDPDQAAQHSGNDYAFFRLAEMYLIKAEALNELGQTAEAVDPINLVRARAFDPDEPLQAGDFNQQSLRDQLLRERGYELANEATRRQDLIRYEVRTGTPGFTGPWQFKEAGSEPFRVVFPIPQPQLDANPNLTQNPGY